MLKLIATLSTGVTGIIAGLLAFITRKVGTAAGTIATFVLITAGFIACINAILQYVLTLIVVPAFVANSIGLFIPIDFVAVLSAIVSSKVCRAAYELTKFKIVAINNAS